MGLGSLVAALVVGSLGRPRPWLIIGGALVLGILEVVLAGIHSYPAALVAMFGAGAGAIAMMISANTSIQLAVPDRLRGRVLAVYTTVFAGSTPIGAPIIGWLASAYSTEVALLVGGGTAILTAAVAGLWILRGGLGQPIASPGRGTIVADATALQRQGSSKPGA
jgi:MFS family permease